MAAVWLPVRLGRPVSRAGSSAPRAMPVQSHREVCWLVLAASRNHSLKIVRHFNPSHVETEVTRPGTRRIREPLRPVRTW